MADSDQPGSGASDSQESGPAQQSGSRQQPKPQNRSGSRRPSGSSSGTDSGSRLRRLRWKKYVGNTTIRVSSVVLLVVFIACCLLYGYTSQRYGVVSPEPPRPAPRTTQYTPEPTYERLPETSTTVPSTSAESSESQFPLPGEPGSPGTGQPGESSDRGRSSDGGPTTDAPTIPGLPGVEIPRFGAPTQTTPVPTR